MNERIREIAEQHGFIHEHMTIGERNDALTKYREFAELIVRECADIADKEYDVLGCGYITKTKGMKIRENFGVE